MGRSSLLLLLPLFCLITGVQSQDCQNGGFPNGTGCNCPSFWGGNDCSQIICLNGGSMKAIAISATPPAGPTFQRCDCPTGYIGVHCEAVGTITPPLNFFPKKTNVENSFNLVFINALSNYWGGVAYTQFQLALNNHFGYSNYSKYKLLTNNNSYSLSLPPGTGQNYGFHVYDMEKNKNLPDLKTPVDYSCYPIPYLKEILSQLINGLTLRETAITIFTQHPPADDLGSLNEILQKAVSFDIRINVIWSDDSTFIRCEDGSKDVLRNLARQTGGLFVTLKNDGDYSANPTIMDTVLATHYQYEPLTMAVSQDENPSVTFYMNPPATKSYYIVLSGANDDNTKVTPSNCFAFNNVKPIKSADGIWSYAITGYMGSICSLSVTNASTVQVFGTNFVNGGPISVSLIKSYVEDPSLDTSRVQPDEGNQLYFALHAEGNGAFANPNLLSATFYQGDSTSPTPLGMRPRSKSDGLLEYISNVNITCQNSQTPAWIELSLQGSAGVAEKRYIPVYCQPQPSGSPPADYAHFGEDDGDEPTSTPVISTTQAIPSEITPKSFILAYSALVQQGIHRDFILAAMPHTGPYSPYNSSFGEMLFDTKTGVNDTWGNQENYADFNAAVQGKYYPGAYTMIDKAAASEILQALLEIQSNIGMDNSTFNQNSIVAVNVGRLPRSDSSIVLENFYPLVMNNVKVVFFIGTSALQAPTADSISLDILKKIAAITSGHVIVYDDTEIGAITSLVTSALGSGPGQNLLLAKNFPATVTSTTSLGVIDLTHVAGGVPVYVTMTDDLADNTAPLISVSPFNVYFTYSNGDPAGSTAMVRKNISNYYVSDTTVILAGGQSYTAWTRSILSTNAKAIRIWTSYNVTSPDVQVAYYDLKNKEAATPDTNQGASLAATLQGDPRYSYLAMKLSDCTGQTIKLYDSNQPKVLPSDDDTVHFVPFFCTVQQGCSPGTEGLYYAQLTSANGYISTKSFICVESPKEPVPECNHKDSNGNYICGGSSSPYTRGPSGQLIDCSGSPLLVYDQGMVGNGTYAPFSCNCTGQGASCEAATCGPRNTEGGAVDMLFRTYTVILAGDTVNPIKQIVTDSKGMLAPTVTPSNIWLYQLIFSCISGKEYILYIGTSYSTFLETLNNVNQFEIICNSTTTNSFDLNQIFETSLKAVGRQQRGLIVFYTELSGGMPYNITVDKEAFIERAQQYRQELYIFNMYDNPGPTMNPDVVEAVMTTGGTFIPCASDNYYGEKILTDFFINILPVPSSFNGHSINDKVINVTIESDKTAYVIVGSNGSLGRTNSFWQTICNTPEKMGDPEPDTMISDYGAVCVSKPTITATFPSDNIWYTVVVLEDPSAQVPRAVIIQERTDDQQTSVAVAYTTGGPTFAIYSGYYNNTNFINEDETARSAIRQCTYDRTTVNAFTPLTAGYGNIRVDVTPAAGSTTVTKVFSFGVSGSINCEHGKPNDGFGQCANDKNWEGPDSSRPICQHGGALSTWGTACNCQGTGYGGQFCEIQLTSGSSTTPAPEATSTILSGDDYH